MQRHKKRTIEYDDAVYRAKPSGLFANIQRKLHTLHPITDIYIADQTVMGVKTI